MKVIKSPAKGLEGGLFLEVEKGVKEIISQVKEKGDIAIREYTQKFDGVKVKNLRVEGKLLEEAEKFLMKEEKESINYLKERLEFFSRLEKEELRDFMIKDNIEIGKKWIPIEKVGIYVPGGKFPLVSSLLMAGVPAKIAGVKEIIVCSPPREKGEIHPAILYTAKLLGIKNVYRVGGVQAIAGMTFGTETIPKVDKIVGPGNIYVTTAKKILFGLVGIDLLAGPSEVVVLADEGMSALWIEKSLLAQLEHGKGSIAILLTSSSILAEEIFRRMDILEGEIRDAWELGGGIFFFSHIEEAIEWINRFAPEHLILGVRDPERILPRITNAGTIFLGYLTPVVAGDLAVGTNHILPTSGGARFSSSLSVFDFLKGINVVKINGKGLEEIYPVVKSFCKLEGLKYHLEELEVRRDG